MINAFNHFIQQECGVDPKARILVALSGGPDSVCMLHLLKISGFNLEVAHCNFQLRGKESDDDENFVAELCKNWDIPLSINKFNTIKFAAENKISIEMAARQLRYDWFEILRADKNLDHIAVAHNSNDSAETFFLNLARGTGLAGLTGIKPVNEYIIRPILFATRTQILQYLAKNNLRYCTDSTNESEDITRNYIRHKILPAFLHLNPSFINSLTDTMQLLKAAGNMNEKQIEQNLLKLIHFKENHTFLSTNTFQNQDEALLYIFHAIKKYGFNSTQVRQITESLTNAGRMFTSVTHELLIDRNRLIIREKKKIASVNLSISSVGKFEYPAGNILLENIPCCPPYSGSPYEIMINAEKVQFPLTLRNWRKGDKLMPLGMKGFKKASDMLVDAKIDLFTKENVLVLENADHQIIWLVGIRLDERFKLPSTPTSILRIAIYNNH